MEENSGSEGCEGKMSVRLCCKCFALPECLKKKAKKQGLSPDDIAILEKSIVPVSEGFASGLCPN